MNVAYIISAYKLPDLLVRLVERIATPTSTTFIHVDAKTAEPVFRRMHDPLCGYEHVHFLPRHPCYWGDFGHVRATLSGLRALIASGRPFDYVVLLTGQDYPIRSTTTIEGVLAESDGQVFMDWMPVPNDIWSDGGTDRFEHWHLRVGRRQVAVPGAPFRTRALRSAWARATRALGMRRRFPANMQPYGGSSYWMLPADCARYVDEFVRANPAFVRFFKRVLVPDEMFFQTIVLNSAYRDRLAKEDLRYIDWRDDADHPRVLTSADVGRFMKTRALFARKFDPAFDAAVLDRIDSAVAHDS